MSKIKFYTVDKLNRISLLELRSEARKLNDELVARGIGSIPLWSTKPKDALIKDIRWGYSQFDVQEDEEEPETITGEPAMEDEEIPETTPILKSQVEDADFEDVEEPDFDEDEEPDESIQEEEFDDEDLLTDTDDVEEPDEEGIEVPETDVAIDEEEEIPSKSEIVRNALEDGIDDLDSLEELLLEYYPDTKRSQVSTYKSQQKKKLGL